MSNNRKFWQEFLSSLIAIIIILIALFVIFKFTNLFRFSEEVPPEIERSDITEEKIEEAKEKIKRELSDFEKYQRYNKLSIYPNSLVTPSDYINNPEKTLIEVSKTIISISLFVLYCDIASSPFLAVIGVYPLENLGTKISSS